MTGFLPVWAAYGGVAICALRTVHTLLRPTPIPLWLLPAAGILVAGTIR